MGAREVRVVGHGVSVLPIAPFEIATRVDDDRIIFVRHGEPAAKVLMAPQRGEPPQLALMPAGTELSDVFDEIAEPKTEASWRLVTAEWSIPFPRGFTAWSTHEPSAWLFELTPPGAPGDAMMYLQTLTAPIELQSLVTPAMKAVLRETERMILEYAHDGATWRQVRQVVRVGALRVLLTAQAPVGEAEPMFAGLADVIAGLRALR